MLDYRHNITSYKFSLESGNPDKIIKDYACFSQLYVYGQPKEITIFNTKCDHTLQYRDFYLQYIIDMFKLEASFNEDEFIFKSLKDRYKDLLVCTLVRMLWERIGCSSEIDNAAFLESLKNGKSKYRDKLKRFCDFYSKIDQSKANNYWGEGHTPKPDKIKIKSSKDFINAPVISGVNNFFYKD